MKMKKAGKMIPYILLGGVFCLLVFLNAVYQLHWLDSDMAAEMMFSKLLAEEGRLFATPDWYYSTEFRFLYTQLIMAPLFKITDNWHVIRMVTNILFYIFLLASYYYFMKPFRVKRETAAATSVILLLPFSETMMTHVQMGNTYMAHMIIVFLFFGMFLRLAGGESIGRARRWEIFCFYLVLAAICGVSGVRYLFVLQCPLLLAAALYVLRSESFQSFRKNMTGENGKKILRADEWRYFCWALLGFLGSVAGYGVNVLYVSRQYVFQTYGSTLFIPIYDGELFERIQNALGCLLMLFGYIPEKSVLSLRGIVTLGAFVLLGALVWCTARVFRDTGASALEAHADAELPESGERAALGELPESGERAVSGEKTGHAASGSGEQAPGKGAVPEKNVILAGSVRNRRYFVTLFLIVTFCVNLFVFIFTTSTMVPRYYLTVFVFVLPVLCFFLEGNSLSFDRLAVGAAITACLLLGTAKVVYSFVTTDKNESKYQVADFLEQNGYHFGFATYTNGNIITEITNGAVEIANVGDPEYLEYFTWSSPAKYYEEGYWDGEAFLLLTAEEERAYADAQALRAGEKVYEDGSYAVYLFDSVRELKDCGAKRSGG